MTKLCFNHEYLDFMYLLLCTADNNININKFIYILLVIGWGIKIKII